MGSFDFAKFTIVFLTKLKQSLFKELLKREEVFFMEVEEGSVVTEQDTAWDYFKAYHLRTPFLEDDVDKSGYKVQKTRKEKLPTSHQGLV